jgi:antitoxin component of MazEF toxin-antitoxin module
MTITKKLTKHGNSFALIIERPILDLLGIDSETLLQISTPDGISITITPIKNKAQQHRFSASLKKINKKYDRTLKRLAK